jgi:hypothetical protein
MQIWKRPLTESLLIGSVLALAIIFIAQRQIFPLLDWIGPVFYLPAHGASILSGNSQEPPPWLFHTVLVIQCILLVFIVGWLLGRYRSRPAKV